MAEQLGSPVASDEKPRTSVKVIVLVIGILGILAILCSLCVGLGYTVLPSEFAPAGTSASTMRLGGWMIAGLLCLPGLIMIVIAAVLWFFLWRKK